jgi:hypothetical protein
MDKKLKERKAYINSLSNNSGHINPVPEKFGAKNPDYNGYLKIDNTIFKVSGWVSENKSGNKSISLRICLSDEYGKAIPTMI